MPGTWPKHTAGWVGVAIALATGAGLTLVLTERGGLVVLALAEFCFAAAGVIVAVLIWKKRAFSRRQRRIRVAQFVACGGATALLVLSPLALSHQPSRSAERQPTDPVILDAMRGLERKLEEIRAASEPKAHASGGYNRALFQTAPLLYDRDPESWRGHRYGEPPLKLDESTRLEMPVGEWQRFNPQLMTAEALFNVNIFVIVPRSLEVREPKLWRISSSDNETAQYWALIGEASPGIIQGINEALYLKAKTPGRFNVAYVISGRGEQSGGLQPAKRILAIEAK
jgi:hypothetical protein